jgi:hypothetical protein
VSDVSGDHIVWVLVYTRVDVVCAYTDMRRITTYRSTTDRIYDCGPVRLYYYYYYYYGSEGQTERAVAL